VTGPQNFERLPDGTTRPARELPTPWWIRLERWIFRRNETARPGPAREALRVR
jgi:hypothetical protein